MRKPTIWVSDQVDTNRAVQLQKIARSLKFRTKEEERLYYPCSENKGADQLRGYREAGLRLCFRLCRLLVFLCSGSNGIIKIRNNEDFLAFVRRVIETITRYNDDQPDFCQIKFCHCLLY